MTRIVITDHAFIDTEHEAGAAERTGAELDVHQCVSSDETTEAVRGADVAIVNFAPMGEEQLAAMSTDATVIRYGVGYDNVDIEAARRLGIAVANVPDYGVDTVADHAASLLLGLLRRLPVYDRGIRDAGWVTPGSVGPIRSFPSVTVGLLGAGRIARSLADRLKPFGFRVIASDPYASSQAVAEHGIELVESNELVDQADAISLHLPLTPKTQHLVDSEFLATLRPGCIIVNTSRGPLIDEHALANAIRDGRIGGAGLDVFEPEPLAPDSPLRACPNVVLTPHAAFYSTSSLDNLQRLAAEEAERALTGQPLRCPIITKENP
ncbi:C-terminal binding protein [Pseudoclavibacter sp. RFBB5]|uniref:C-terminal binding protein n=1 Tax=Pseudoclavibacter sp. RFBB5 TaxID=2080574 RepID=UPI000CE7EED2|nr:C-terminal binding protein [Pseudoclavibacter sp. RFBB5]PPG32110.1 dihydrofolate reductase [Pseudoclavibacter sp. RFBB5]